MAMTWRSFFARDIQFFAINGVTIFATNIAFLDRHRSRQAMPVR